MTALVVRACACGATLKARSTPPGAAEDIARMFDELHASHGDEPVFTVPLDVLFSTRTWGDGEWTWRCTVTRHTGEDGYRAGDCAFDHNVGSRAELVRAATEHLARWHGISPADCVGV